MHMRSKIRKEFIRRLCDNTTARERVYDSRIYNLEKDNLPGIIIFTDHEDIVTDTISFPRSQSRHLRVTVECYVKSNDAVSVAIDNLSLEIEQLIMTDNNLGNLVKDCRLESSNISFNNDGERPVSVATLIFLVLYQSVENKPFLIRNN